MRQTIVETVEAPRLQDVTTAAFVAFAQQRAIYVRKVEEKNQDSGIAIALTSYRNSIPDSILRLFIVAKWVPVSAIADITEAHLEQVVKDHSRVAPVDYDLAYLERKLQDRKLWKPTRGAGPKQQVWKLCLGYTSKLEACGYAEFIDRHPKIAVHHLLKRLTHKQLRSRMLLALRLRKVELENDFSAFMCTVAKEAEAVDRVEVARGLGGNGSDSDSDRSSTERRRKRRRRERRSSPSGERTPKHPKSREKDQGRHKMPSGGSKRKREQTGELPDCLNTKCDKKQFVNNCDITSDSDKKRLKQEYFEKKRRKEDRVGRVQEPVSEDNPSLFSASFLNGGVESAVMADQGSDVTVMPPWLLSDLLKADPSLPVSSLDWSMQLGNANKEAPPLSCKRVVTVDCELRIRHGDRLLLRGMKWLVSDEDMAHAYIGHHFLSALGLDNRVLMAAARDWLGSVVEVPEMLQEAGCADGPCASSAVSIQSILADRGMDWGRTYHSFGGDEDDKLEDSGVYVDLGEDPPGIVDAALSNLVEQARASGVSDDGATRLESLLTRYKAVFRVRLGKAPPADVPPMRVRLQPGCKAVRVKARRYSPEQRRFLDKYVDTLRAMDFVVDLPTAEWQAAPLLVPKPNSAAKFRLAVDLRPVNAATIKEAWPMPHLDSEVQDFSGSTCFAGLDFVSGYWQLPVHPDSYTSCGIVTPRGVVASKRVLPGLANATS